MTSQQEGHSQVKVITFANSPLTWKALPISLNVPPSCNFKQALGEWTNYYPNLPLVRGTSKRNKGINCCTDFCKLQSFCLMLEWEKGWSTTLLLFTRPLNTSFSTGIVQRNKENEHRDVKNKVASLTDVATFNVFDVEVGLFLVFSSIRVLPTPDKRAQQRNKGMAENHTKSLV